MINQIDDNSWIQKKLKNLKIDGEKTWKNSIDVGFDLVMGDSPCLNATPGATAAIAHKAPQPVSPHRPWRRRRFGKSCQWPWNKLENCLIWVPSRIMDDRGWSTYHYNSLHIHFLWLANLISQAFKRLDVAWVRSVDRTCQNRGSSRHREIWRRCKRCTSASKWIDPTAPELY